VQISALVPSSNLVQFAQIRKAAASVSRGLECRRAARVAVFALFCACVCPASWGQSDSVLTYHFDNYRDGQQTDETILVPANVSSAKFGKLFSDAVDGIVVAEPLYVPNVMINGASHNVVYVVTQHDSVYAFDADTAGSPLWQTSFLNPSGTTCSSGALVCTVPIANELCAGTGWTEIGIMGTPVIDPVSGTLYLSAKTMEPANTSLNQSSAIVYVHTLHALDITTGLDKVTPTVVNASVVNAVGNTVTLQQNNLPQCQRPGLTLSNGTLFVAYGSNGCDLHSYGWVLAYNPNTFQQLGVFNTAPTPAADYRTGASLWMSGGGLAVDDYGSLYLSTANGPFDGSSNWGDTVLKLDFSGSAVNEADYFTPYDQEYMGANDLDLGSGGVTLIDQPTAPMYPHLLVTSGKTGNIYLINRDNMGHYNPDNNPPLSDNSNIVQFIPSALGLFNSVPLYWSGNDRIYFAALNGDPIKAFQLVNGMISPTTPVATSLKYSQAGVPVISSSGSTGGIVWNIHNPATPLLSALDANTLTEMYNSGQAKNSRDTLGPVAHFATPTIANNKVFVGTTTNLSVYGVFPFLALLGGNGQSATVGTALSQALVVQAVDSQGHGDAGVSVTFSASATGGTFNPPTAVTDSTGTATTSYTVPTKMGTINVTASSTSTAPAYRSVLLSVTATAGPATVIAKSGGVGQYGTAGTTLAQPLLVYLRDKFGNGIVGQQISFTDNGAGGTFSANTLITGAAGVASVSYTLPKKSGYILLTATSGTVTTSAAEHSVAGPATAVNIITGNNQSAATSTRLKSLLVVSVTDQYGNVIPDVSVAFSDGGAGGTFSSPNPTTNLGGQANTGYTTPPQAKVVNITATVSGLPAAKFTETVVSK